MKGRSSRQVAGRSLVQALSSFVDRRSPKLEAQLMISRSIGRRELTCSVDSTQSTRTSFNGWLAFYVGFLLSFYFEWPFEDRVNHKKAGGGPLDLPIQILEDGHTQ